MSMKFVILHQTIAEHDAIGNDIANMFRMISSRYPCWVYCTSHKHKKLPLLSRNELLNIIQSHENVLVYHHSNFWLEGEELLGKAKCKIIIRYHNVTPELFFDKYDASAMHACRLGREQTIRLAGTLSGAFWVCDSQYNLSEVAGISTCSGAAAVVPPLHNIEQWSTTLPDEKILKGLLQNGITNLLFVGRVVPNKNHLFLIDCMYRYMKHFDRNIKLWIIGKKTASLQKYYKVIDAAINCYGLNGHVVFADECTDRQLLAYYLGCDFFVCASKHEGVCVPLIEAHALRLPVIASPIPAVAETLGNNQVCVENDPLVFASAVNELTNRPDFKTFLIQQGVHNYMTRFHPSVIEQQFKQIFHDFTGADL
jgi:glycosyltransferase involved in cell wall biosynthesis